MKRLHTIDLDINKVSISDEKLFEYKNKIELRMDKDKKVELVIETENGKEIFEIKWYDAYVFFSLCSDLLLGKFTIE